MKIPKKKYKGLERSGSWVLYLFLIPAVVLTFLFGYLTFFSIPIAFMDYNMFRGWFGLGSDWVGLRHFQAFLTDSWFWEMTGRTVLYSFIGIIIGFPASLILALLFNELRNANFKKTVQTISYVPNFVSWVTVAGLVYLFMSIEPTGLINNIVTAITGGERVSYMMNSNNFLPVLVLTGVWKSVGWGTIMYMAAIAGIDPQLYEAAEIDGAGRLGRAVYITFPGLLPIFCILLIFATGGLFSVSFDQVFNLENQVIRENVQTIDFFTYQRGIIGGRYSQATAVGLFQSAVSFLLVITVNKVARKVSDTGIF